MKSILLNNNCVRSILLLLTIAALSLTLTPHGQAGGQSSDVPPTSSKGDPKMDLDGVVLSVKEMPSAWAFGVSHSNRLLLLSRKHKNASDLVRVLKKSMTQKLEVQVTLDLKTNLVTSVKLK